MTDLVLQSARAGHLVIWEEVARDGAQARTLLLGPQRVTIARAHAALYGAYGPHHLIFAAGFPAVCAEERDAIRQVIYEVDTCQIACHARCKPEDIDLTLRVLRGARHGRITLIVPMSERLTHALLHQSNRDALAHAREMARYALDRSHGIAVDVALMDAPRCDPSLLVEAIGTLSEEGVGVAKICDSMGELFPAQLRALLATLKRQLPEEVVLGVHLHNDFGLALANTLEAVQQDVRVVSSAWLGLGERNGLAATEQVLAALAYQPELLRERLPAVTNLWQVVPDLQQITAIAGFVSDATAVPLKVTDPIVGSGINTRSTGTAFVAPHLFQPFDPEVVLGVPPRVVLTQLASHRLVTTYAAERGFLLTPRQADIVLAWVKRHAFQQGSAVVSEEAFTVFLAGLCAIDAIAAGPPSLRPCIVEPSAEEIPA